MGAIDRQDEGLKMNKVKEYKNDFEIIDEFGDLIDIVSKSDPDARSFAHTIAGIPLKQPGYKRGEYKKEHTGFCLLESCQKPITGNAKKRFCAGGICRQKYARAQQKLSQS